MTKTNKLKLIKKVQSMNIVANTIQITLSKGQLNNILAEAMTDEVASAAIKRILNPFIANSFNQFPHHTNITLGETTEAGTTVALKIPTVRKPVVEGEPETKPEIVDEQQEEVADDLPKEPFSN